MLGVLKRKSSVRVTVFVLLLTIMAWMAPTNIQDVSAAEDSGKVVTLPDEMEEKGMEWQEVSLLQEDILTKESTSRLVAHASTIPTPTEVYEAMIALKDQEAYKEGATWTNDEPYSESKGYYRWKGGPLGGYNIVAAGCVAFAFILSDAAFDSLPARMYAAGEFKFEDIKSGDILRVNNDTHTVIVLQVSDVGVIIAEGNLSTRGHKGKVHWGRAISKADVMNSTSHYITRYPEGYVLPDDPAANEIIQNGALDGGLTWNLTKAGTLTISGKGAMPDFSSTGEQPWNNYSSQIRKVVIGNGVTSIGSCAFWNCGVLCAEISSSVTAIGNSAFRGSSIIAVDIPSSIKTIGDSAFRECQNLSSVTIFEGLETIDQNAFRACTNLTSIALPASVGEVGAGAFFECTVMKNATFAPGSKQVKLGDNMFTRCYYLMNVTLPKKIDCIGEGMFQNCLTLDRVEIPQGAESIGNDAFASSAVSVVIIPSSVTAIGIAAFASCPLTDIYFTGTETQWNSISKIGDTASAVSKAAIHYNYISGTSPDQGTGSTEPTDSPTEPVDPTGESTTVSTNPTEPSEAPTEPEAPIVPTEPEQPTVTNPTEKPVVSAPIKTGTVVQDKSSKASYVVTKTGSSNTVTYKKSTDSNKTAITIPATIKIAGKTYKVNKIANNAFKNNAKIKSIKMGSNIQIIGANAFKNCTKVTSIVIPSKVTTIQKGAFASCKNLKSITIKTTKLTNKGVGAGAFKGTAAQAKVKTPKGKAKIYKKLLQAKGLNKKATVK